MAKRFEKLLMDSWRDVYEESWQISRDNFPGLPGPHWTITKFTLRGGKQHGVSIVEIDNGEMTVSIAPDRGMNVLEAATDEVAMGFDSPVKEVVHPSFVQEGLRGGLGWLEGFNELVCRCGLESHGAPGPDTITDNQGRQKTVVLTLHGRISNTPASRLWVSVELDPPYRLTVSGDVYDTRMFGPNYLLHTDISTVPGAAEFTIADEISNLGATPAPMEILYHCNYGPPLLGAKAKLIAPARKVSARDRRALEGMKTWDVYAAPEAGYSEQCYFFNLYGDSRGQTTVALVSPEEELAATLRFSTRQLPAFTLWKNTAADLDGYVTGLEPGSSYPNPRQFEREKGRVVTLAPGGVYKTSLAMGLVQGKSAVKALRKDIAAIAKGRKTEVCAEVDHALAPPE